MSQSSSLPPFIDSYLAIEGVDPAVLASARAKRHTHGREGAKQVWSEDEERAYGLYRAARSEYRATEEGRRELLREFDSITPSLLTLADETFAAQVLEGAGPILVQFFARWCGPCHAAAAVLEQVARAGFTIGKLDCEGAPQTARRFAVKSYPTLLFFDRGGLRGLYRGTRTVEAISAWIEAGGKQRGIPAPAQ